MLSLASLACEDPFFALYDAGPGDAGAVDSGPVDPCFSLTASISHYAAQGGTWSAVQYQNQALFASTADPAIFRATLRGAQRATDLILPQGFLPLGLAVRGDELWIAGADGTLAHGSLTQGTPFARASTVALPAHIRFVGTSPPDMPLEVYAITDDEGLKITSLYRFDGSRFTELYRRDFVGSIVTTQDSGYGGIVWMGPNEVFALFPFPNQPKCVVHYHGRSVVEEETDARSPLTAIASIPGIGIFAGAHNGDIVMRGERGWPRLSSPFLMRQSPILRAILPLPNGFLAVSDNDVVQWRQNGGFCDPIFYAMGQLPEAGGAVEVPGGFVVVGPPTYDRIPNGTIAILKRGAP